MKVKSNHNLTHKGVLHIEKLLIGNNEEDIETPFDISFAEKIDKTAEQILEEQKDADKIAADAKAAADAEEATRLALEQANETEDEKTIRLAKEDANKDAGEANNENEDDLTAIQIAQKKEGFLFTGEDGKPKNYDDTIEGIAEYYNDITEKKIQDTIKEKEIEFTQSLPQDVRDYYAHRQAGGTPESFFQDPLKDIANVTLTKDNVELQERILKTRYEVAGFSPEEVKSLVTKVKASDTLYTDSVEALKGLQILDVKNKEQRDLRIKQIAEAEEKEAIALDNQIKTIIKSGKLGEITIPANLIPKLEEYVLKPIDKHGNTQHTLAMQKETLAQDLILALWRMQGYDMNALIKEGIKKANVASLTQKLAKTKEAGTQGNKIENKNLREISIENIQ